MPPDSVWGERFRSPPANLQAEQGLLGALLANNKAIERCGGLKSEHFADPIHARIFQAITRRLGAGQIADAVGLRDDFQNSGVLDDIGGPAYLAQLLSSMVGIINAGEYSRSIRDNAARRSLIDIGETMVSLAFGGGDPTASQIAMQTVGLIDAIAADGLGDLEPVRHDEAMDLAIAAMERARAGLVGMPTGFRVIDDRLGGIEPGLVYALGGRPGMGKSALGHGIALNLARAGHPVL